MEISPDPQALIALKVKIFYYFFFIGGTGLSPWYRGHFWPIVQTPDDR
jgi:hypothetical protein